MTYEELIPALHSQYQGGTSILMHRDTWTKIEEMGFVVQTLSGGVNAPSPSYVVGGLPITFDDNIDVDVVIITHELFDPRVIRLDSFARTVVFVMKDNLHVHGAFHPTDGRPSLRGQTVKAIETAVPPTSQLARCEKVYRVSDKGPFFGFYICNHMIDHFLSELPSSFKPEDLPKRRIKRTLDN